MTISGKPPRFHQGNALYFLTFCTYKRLALLHYTGIPEVLIDNLRVYSKRLEELIAYTIMPDHIHLLVSVQNASDLSAFLRDFKKWTAMEINLRIKSDGLPVWQRGTMDHCIRNSESSNDLDNHLLYLFSNSWKHLGIAPRDFPYHNFSEMVANGWLEEDFCDFTNDELQKRYEL